MLSPQCCHICEEKNEVRGLESKQNIDVVKELGVFEIYKNTLFISMFCKLYLRSLNNCFKVLKMPGWRGCAHA